MIWQKCRQISEAFPDIGIKQPYCNIIVFKPQPTKLFILSRLPNQVFYSQKPYYTLYVVFIFSPFYSNGQTDCCNIGILIPRLSYLRFEWTGVNSSADLVVPKIVSNFL